jgi:hypothetical protein
VVLLQKKTTAPIPATEVPRDRTERTDWLFHWWETIDDRINSTWQQESRELGDESGAGWVARS